MQCFNGSCPFFVSSPFTCLNLCAISSAAFTASSSHDGLIREVIESWISAVGEL
jgi:hypothetical protein